MLTLGSRVIGIETAASCAEAFLAARFSGDARHIRRVAKVKAIEADGPELARAAEKQP